MKAVLSNIDVIIETPKGSHAKYVYDEVLRAFRLKKILPEGMVFPFDLGFVPGTKGEDGDPLDVLVLWESASFTGCVISCRIIGGIKAKQNGKGNKKIRNDRFIAIPEASKIFKNISSVGDIPVQVFTEIKQFFLNYTAIEKKGFEYMGVLNKRQVLEIIEHSS